MFEKITIVENILSANDKIAAENRLLLDQKGIFSLNFMASPGAGKTSLVEQTVRGLGLRHPPVSLAMINGDIATSLDADRASAAGARAMQINTGGECHLDAVMLHEALSQIVLDGIDVLIVENVGNLVCPSSFKLGTHKSVLVASIPEGDDKPYKYPGMYRGVDALVINKIDLLPYINFDMDFFRRGVEILNPGLKAFELSCKTGEGIPAWLDWIAGQTLGK